MNIELPPDDVGDLRDLRTARMWPLDVAIVALSGLVLYLIFTQLDFSDSRWWANAWTYSVLVPLTAVALAVLMRNLVSQHVQKSIQLGFLTSVLVHLTLLLVAVRWVILPAYFPDALTGTKPKRNPIRKMIPEYVFDSPKESAETPDWSKPVDSETKSRVVPEQLRQLLPMDRSAATTQVPQPQTPRELADVPYLNRLAQPNDAMPQPADEPSKLARRIREPKNATAPLLSRPVAPELPVAAEPSDAIQERLFADLDRRQNATMPSSDAIAMMADPSPMPLDAMMSLPTRRREPGSVPEVESPSVNPSDNQRAARSTNNSVAIAAAQPTVPSVAIARDRPDQSRRISADRLNESPNARPRRRTEPQVSLASPSLDFGTADAGRPLSAGSLPAARDTSLPEIRQPGLATARQRTSRTRDAGMTPLGTAIEVPDQGSRGKREDVATNDGPATDRLSDAGTAGRSPARKATPAMSSQTATPVLDVLAPLGVAGLGSRPAIAPGLLPADTPQIAAMEFSRGKRPKRRVGGPATPLGSEVASVESFSRRVKRTQGGAAAAPAGAVGQETEEAIERGLAFLADKQNDDGSWSLQGHGEDVMLRSDTAATGLCLLAFQGAGYTHKQHQYAGVVGKGLDFLKRVQRTNGDLYRAENALSNRNVAFYSHGIAALAVSEAYGMTQDEQLREPAQLALDFIAATQHQRLGGWRYTPQVSADTSVTGWMMMALKSGELSGLKVKEETYRGIDRWLSFASESASKRDRYRYDPFAPSTPSQSHGRRPTPTMTSVGMLMRMYSGWRRDREEMKSAAEYLLEYPPEIGTPSSPQRDTYYWYYATQVMFHMGGNYWQRWNQSLNPVLLKGQIKRGQNLGSWNPNTPVPDRWAPHGGRLYVTTMNLLNLEVYYRHLPIYEDTAN